MDKLLAFEKKTLQFRDPPADSGHRSAQRQTQSVSFSPINWAITVQSHSPWLFSNWRNPFGRRVHAHPDGKTRARFATTARRGLPGKEERSALYTAPNQPSTIDLFDAQTAKGRAIKREREMELQMEAFHYREIRRRVSYKLRNMLRVHQ